MRPRDLKTLYQSGQNISACLRQDMGLSINTEEIIEVSYDLQAGSYTSAMSEPRVREYKARYTEELARVVSSLCRVESILEAGVGEATTLSGVLHNLAAPGVRSYGFDISWSRLAHARKWLHANDLTGTVLCAGSLFHIPFATDAIDVVFTSHAIESNGGKEAEILRELYRVARKYLILLEPAYELATTEARARMESHGYCKNLKATAESLGMKVVDYRPFPVSANPLNPTALLVIEKGPRATRPSSVLACPKFKTPLEELGGMLFSPEALLVYPIVGGIPCLRIEHGIIASSFPEFTRSAPTRRKPIRSKAILS